MADYKYQKQIDALLDAGYPFPVVFEPNEKSAFRFVFLNQPTRNHLPVCVANPKRILPGPVKCSGFALSCFGDEVKAKVRYSALKSTFKNISSAIGDAIASGMIENQDGMITEEDSKTSHFDLYEFKDCDLHKSFTIKETLV